MAQQNSQWRPVPGWPYSVSDHGQVRSDHTGRILKPMRVGRKRKQYDRVMLCNNGQQWAVNVHILVLEVFVGPRPPGMNGLHKDDDTKNNKLSNLYWGTLSQNSIDKAKRTNVLLPQQVKDIRRRRTAGERGRSLAAEYGVSEQLICDIFKGRHYPYY